jgi:periplasmic divalent cation tolerance protein
MTDKIIVFSTCASQEEADRMARELVERRLAACVAITPRIRSVYRWQGSIETSEEWGLAIKSRRELFPALHRELKRLHSYQVPEVLAVPVLDGSADYLEWMDAELKPPGDSPAGE